MTVDTKGIGDALNTNLQVGTAIRTTQTLDAIAQENDARQKAEIAKLKANASRSTSSASNWSSDYEAMQLRGALDKAQSDLAAANALVQEWKHSNNAFKMLARKYGAKLGVDDDQRQADFIEEILSLADTEAEFSQTRIANQARASR